LLLKLLLEAVYALEPDCTSHGNHIHNSGHKFYHRKYKHHFENLFSLVGDYSKTMDSNGARLARTCGLIMRGV
jgi:hypothetical protein